MYILYNILIALACFVSGYLIGAFPTSVVIGKVFFHKDPRDYGSHNPGGTNAGRLFGKKVGLLIIILDMIKTIAPLWIWWAILNYSGLKDVQLEGQPLLWDAPLYYYLSALGTCIGHCWPIYLGFKGGKAVSNFMGIACGSSWVLFLVSFLYFVYLKMKKYVSLTAILIAATHVIAVWTIFIINCFVPATNGFVFWGWGACLRLGDQGGWEFPTIMTIMAIILVIRHSSNIKRLKEGNERKITWMK